MSFTEQMRRAIEREDRQKIGFVRVRKSVPLEPPAAVELRVVTAEEDAAMNALNVCETDLENQ